MREVDVFKKLWKEFLENEKELGFEKAKAKYLKEYKDLDMYKVEKSRIKSNIDKNLKEHNDYLRDAGAKEIEFNLKEENIAKLITQAQNQTLARIESTTDINELKSIHMRGTLISAGKKVQEVSSYVNLLLNQEIRNLANTNTNSFAKEQGYQVVIVNSIHVPNELCDDYIGNTYDADDDANLPLYHPNCKCTTHIVFSEQDVKDATLITGKEAKDYEKFRTQNVYYERRIRQQQRLGANTSDLRKKRDEARSKLNEIVDNQGHLSKKQKQNLRYAD